MGPSTLCESPLLPIAIELSPLLTEGLSPTYELLELQWTRSLSHAKDNRVIMNKPCFYAQWELLADI